MIFTKDHEDLFHSYIKYSTPLKNLENSIELFTKNVYFLILRILLKLMPK